MSSFTKNWVPDTGPGDLQWAAPTGLPTPLTLHAMRLMQVALIHYGNYGLTVHHCSMVHCTPL